MIRKSIPLLIAAALILAALPVIADTIVPGKYKTTWTTPDDSKFTFADGDLVPVEAKDLASMRGLASRRPLWRMVPKSPNLVIIDESGGTGKGYDTLYVTGDWKQGTLFDVAALPKLCVSLSNLPVLQKDAKLSVMMGPPGSSVQRSFDVDLQFAMDPADQLKPSHISLKLSGKLVGEIRTSGKPIRFCLSDPHLRGDYSGSSFYNITMEPPDSAMSEWPFVKTVFSEPAFDYGGQVFDYDGNVYVAKPSKTGEELDIQPYGGEVGTIVFNMVNGRGKPVKCRFVQAEGKNGGISRIYGARNNRLCVPVGTYHFMDAVPDVSFSANGEMPHGVLYCCRRQDIVVRKGRDSVIRMGGPIKLTMKSADRIITTRKGDNRTIQITADAGSYAGSIFSGATPEFVITDSHEVVVSEGKFSWTFKDTDILDKVGIEDIVYYYDLTPEQSWKPGDYKMVVTYDASPYQEPIKLERTIRVTE